MKLGRIAESEVFDTKVDILTDRLSSVPLLKHKLGWIIIYGGREVAPKAMKVYQKLYPDSPPPKIPKKDYRKRMVNILQNNDIWLDINESWFLKDLDRIIPASWKTADDEEGYKLLQTIDREQGPGDDTNLRIALSHALLRLLGTPSKNEVGPLVAKHILSELFA